MAISKYKNFEDYAENEPKYLLKCLRDEVHKSQAKMVFQDESYYSVTKTGTRRWGYKYYYNHRETGPSSVWIGYSGDTHPHYGLYDIRFDNRESWEEALVRLRDLRVRTENQLESIVEHVALNSSWADKHKIWRSVLSKHDDTDAMIENLKTISDEYRRAKENLNLFVGESKCQED